MAYDSDGRNGLTIAHWRSSLHSSHKGCSSPRSIKNLECTNSFLHFRQLVFSSEAWDFWVQTSQSTSCPSLMYWCLSFSTIVPHMPLHRKVQVLPVEGSCNLKRSNAWWPSTWRSSRRDLWRLMGGMTSCTPHLSTRVKRLLLTTLAAGFGTSGGGVDGVGAAATSGDAAVERKKRCWASSCTERSSLASSSSTVHMGRPAEELGSEAVTKPSLPSWLPCPVPITTTAEPSEILGAGGARVEVEPGKSWTENSWSGGWAWARPLKQAPQKVVVQTLQENLAPTKGLWLHPAHWKPGWTATLSLCNVLRNACLWPGMASSKQILETEAVLIWLDASNKARISSFDRPKTFLPPTDSITGGHSGSSLTTMGGSDHLIIIDPWELVSKPLLASKNCCLSWCLRFNWIPVQACSISKISSRGRDLTSTSLTFESSSPGGTGHTGTVE